MIRYNCVTKEVLNTLPLDLKCYIHELYDWARLNNLDAYRATLGFWVLKIPAIFAAASSGIWAHFDLPVVSLFAGTISAFCIAIDAIHPRGMLRNIHLCARHDILNLSYKIVNQWRARDSELSDDDSVRKIIRDAEEERNRIASYIRDAETALDFNQQLYEG